ncbi:MAG TPA: isoprenylcysteine carboxylmethyltransferase family protein [Candidatus Limnocylindrales bacterium]|nr:isoprenylcysteine carboxylmethyltransferase family protein [Candidatus Limnocylindrales bacterium]
MSKPRKFWMRWRVRLGYPVAILYWLLAHPIQRSILIGAAVALVGLLVRASAAGFLRKDRVLATSGPYAFTRNPLYFGSSMLAAGFVVAGHSWIAGIVVAVYFAVFYYAVMRNEEQDLRARFPDNFPAYAARVPLFIPHIYGGYGQPIAGSAESVEHFSWALFLRNREYRAVLGTIGGFALVWLRMWLRARFGY